MRTSDAVQAGADRARTRQAEQAPADAVDLPAGEPAGTRVTYAFHTQADPDARWLVVRMRLEERVSAPYEATVELVSTEADDPARLLGHAGTLVMRRDDSARFVHGVVSRVVRAGHDAADGVTVTLVPALAALALVRDCRIFQDVTVPDIVERVLVPALAREGREVVRRLRRVDYPRREYVVQYRESDLAFIERLLAEEGIWYCFRHPDRIEAGAEVLYLLDDNDDALEAELGPDGDRLPTAFAHDGVAYQPAMTSFERTRRVSGPGVAVRAYDWTHPNVAAAAEYPRLEAGVRHGYEPDDLTLSGYGEAGYGRTDATAQARLRWERQQARGLTAQARGNVVGPCAGQRVEIADGPDAPPRGWLVTSMRAWGRDAKSTVQVVSHLEDYECALTCVPVERPLRPRRRRKPRVRGVQVGLVVGPDGRSDVPPGADDIHVDEHGRVRVKLSWDRTQAGATDATVSCFLRVAQPWAGGGFGVVFTPRVGMEVVVSFVEGDPDRPLVTGCVYNGVNRPHHALPEHKTRSVIRTQSSPSGQAGSELLFEDADGRQQVALHALRDHREVVGRNQHVEVGADQTVKVEGKRALHVVGDDVAHVDGERSHVVLGPETHAVGGDRVVEVRGSEAKRIDAHRRLEVGAYAKEHYQAGREITVRGTDRLQVPGGGHKQDHVSGKYAITADAQFKVAQGKGELLMQDNLYASVAGEIQLKNPAFSLQAGEDGETTLKVERRLVIQVGRAKIALSADGSIEIIGRQCSMTGDGGQLVVTPAGAALSGTIVSVSGKTLTEITGTLVRIN